MNDPSTWRECARSWIILWQKMLSSLPMAGLRPIGQVCCVKQKRLGAITSLIEALLLSATVYLVAWVHSWPLASALWLVWRVMEGSIWWLVNWKQRFAWTSALRFWSSTMLRRVTWRHCSRLNLKAAFSLRIWMNWTTLALPNILAARAYVSMILENSQVQSKRE